MIEHVVILKLKQGGVKPVLAALGRLSEVPQISSYTFGETFTTDRNQGFQVLLNVRVKTEEDLINYQKHPVHVDVLTNTVKPNLEGITVLDIKV